jgi:hypothetical protein
MVLKRLDDIVIVRSTGYERFYCKTLVGDARKIVTSVACTAFIC